MSAAMSGVNLLAFRGNGFNAARNNTLRTVRRPQQPIANGPFIVSMTDDGSGAGIGGAGFGGIWLSPNANASFGDLFVRFGLAPSLVFFITMRFPGTTTGGAPTAAGGLFLVPPPGCFLTQTDVGIAPTTDILWTLTRTTSFQFYDEQRTCIIHYEWNISH